MPTKKITIEPEDLVAEDKETKVEESSEEKVPAEVVAAPPKEEFRTREDFSPESTTVSKGILEVMPDGYGFLRANGLTSGAGDIYISQSQIRRFDIRSGDEVEGQVRPPKETERYFGMLKVEKVNGLEPE